MSYTSPELDALRLKLVQLIDQINTLQVQLHHASLSTPEPSTSNPGILPWNDLLARYNLLLSQVVGLGSLLNSVGEEKKKGESMDRKRDRWEGSVVAPAFEVEESKDWIVGMLLRTKQTPEVEAHLAHLVDSLPPAFADPTSYEAALKAHMQLTEAASVRIADLKEGVDGEEWDWKGRVEVESDGEEDDEMEVDGVKRKEKVVEPSAGGKGWSIQDVATYQRTGKLPG